MGEPKEKVVDAEVVGGETGLVTQSKPLAVSSDYNRTRFELALSFPRDESAILAKLITELEAFPEIAEKAWYAIPYKQNKDGQTITTMVEGPSIRAALSIAGRWRNFDSGWMVQSMSAEEVVLGGMAFDYETNTKTMRTLVVPKRVWDKYTHKMKDLPESRLKTVIQAEGSKAVRNAILSAIPQHIISAYLRKAKDVASGGNSEMSMDEKLAGMYSTFANELSVTADMVNAYIKELGIIDKKKVLETMRGVYNSISDGQIKTEDIFKIPEAETMSAGEKEIGGDLLGKAK